MFIGEPLSARDITDGLSRTVGVSEWLVAQAKHEGLRLVSRDASIALYDIPRIVA